MTKMIAEMSDYISRAEHFEKLEKVYARLVDMKKQRDDYKAKMNEARRELCRGDAGGELQMGNMVMPQEIAKHRGWDCYDEDGE